MRRHGSGALLKLEVVPVLRALLLLAPGAGAGQHGLAGEEPPRLLAGVRVLADALGQDVHGAGQGLLGAGNASVPVHESLGGSGRVHGVVLRHQEVRQGGQALLGGDGGAGAALGAPRQVDVLQGGHRRGGRDGSPQLIRQKVALGQRVQDGGAALVQLRHPRGAVPDCGDDGLVQRSRRLLAVARDEGDGAAVVEEGKHGLDLSRGELELL